LVLGGDYRVDKRDEEIRVLFTAEELLENKVDAWVEAAHLGYI
jgi:hypothetical protein